MARKKKREIMIPDLKGVTIVQSNRVTNAQYNYTLMQMRSFIWIMYHLQAYITELMKPDAKPVYQLEIFKTALAEHYNITIPLHVLGKHYQYNEIRQSVQQMAVIQIVMHNKEKKRIMSRPLFAGVDMPDSENNKRSGYIKVEIHKQVAHLLIDINKNEYNKPSEYTRFSLYIAMNAQCKYTSRIYMMLCRWRDTKKWNVKIEEFRDWIGLSPGVYENFNDLKRFILVPVANELKQFSDVYYPVNEDMFCREGKKVTMLRFEILFPMNEDMLRIERQNIIYKLQQTFSCTKFQLQSIDHLLIQDNFERINKVILRAFNYCTKEKKDHPDKYVIKCILEEKYE